MKYEDKAKNALAQTKKALARIVRLRLKLEGRGERLPSELAWEEYRLRERVCAIEHPRPAAWLPPMPYMLRRRKVKKS